MTFASLKTSATNLKNKAVQACVAPQNGKDVAIALAIGCSAGIIAGALAKVALNKVFGV